MKWISGLFILLPGLLLFSCQKEKVPEPPTSPQLGTKWIYQYKTFNAAGVISGTYIVRYTATSEEMLGGEAWLKLTDTVTNTFFILKVKSDGLYQHTNGTANLLCKDPAAVNDSYISFNGGASENFTVTDINLSLSVPYGDVNVLRYSGEKGGDVVDILWYTRNLWIVKMEKHVRNIFTGVLHIDKRWELKEIQY